MHDDKPFLTTKYAPLLAPPDDPAPTAFWTKYAGRVLTLDTLRHILFEVIAPCLNQVQAQNVERNRRILELETRMDLHTEGAMLEDVTVEFDGEREFTFVVKRGRRLKMFKFTVPSVLYRGVFEDNRRYEKGDMVTWGGHGWIAKEATDGKPGVTPEASRDWQLAVKKGRDGRNAQ
jgi:hypothetical protein